MRSFERIILSFAAFCAALTLPAYSFAGEKLNFERKTEVVKVVEAVKSCVVNISTERIVRVSSPWDEMFPSYDAPETAKTYSLGSGVIIDEDGYILTNAHVVKRAERIKITLADKKEYDAAVISVLPECDLALIRVKPEGKLSAIRIGTSKDLMVGETAIALGNPFGLSNTVTVGVVSATDRSIEVGEKIVFRDFIQTDAAINPGNSGGPLVNINGELIGVNIAIRSGGTGIGFAIPVDRVCDSVRTLISPNRVADISPGVTLISDPGNGLVIDTVSESAAKIENAPKPGDKIISVEGDNACDFLDLAKHVIDGKAGDKIKIAVLRGGKTADATLVLEQAPETNGQKLAKSRLGAVIKRLPGFKVHPKTGDFSSTMKVESVVKDGPADRVGIKEGDVITGIELIQGRGNYWVSYLQKEIHEYSDVEEFLAKAAKGLTVRITVLRGGEELQGRMILD